MNLRQLFAAAMLLLAACGAAFAKNSTQQLSPQSAKDLGISVTAEPGKDGTVQVTISRDLSKLLALPPDSPVEVCRTATLSVDGDSGLVLQFNLEGEAQEGTIVYRFTIGKTLAGRSRLSIAEMICPKDRGPSELQGHTFFFQLADFIGK